MQSLLVLAGSILIIFILMLVFAFGTQFRFHRIFVFTGGILITVFLLNLFVLSSPSPAIAQDANGLENVSMSIINTLQTVSLDADYGQFLEMEEQAIDWWIQSGPYPAWAWIKPILLDLTAVLNVAAPICGLSSVVTALDILFPVLKIMGHPFRPKIVFTSLSEATILMAEDIHRRLARGDEKTLRALYGLDLNDPLPSSCKRPLLIFTDTYMTSDSEANMELVERAKSIQAICVKSDPRLLHLQKSSRVVYYLMGDTMENYEILSNFTKYSGSQKAGIWSVLQHDYLNRSLGRQPLLKAPFPTESTLVNIYIDDPVWMERIDHLLNLSAQNGDRVLEVNGIKDYMTMGFNLLRDLPLFLPLIEKPESESGELKLLVCGSSSAAKSIVLHSIVLGQMKNHRLSVTVMNPSQSSMEKELHLNYPELMLSCLENEDLLCPDPVLSAQRNRRNSPYARLNFLSLDESEDMRRLMEEALRADYIVLAQDAQTENMEMAQRMKLFLTQRNYDSRRIGRQLVVPILQNSALLPSMQTPLPLTLQIPENGIEEEALGSTERYVPIVIPYGFDQARFSLEAALQMSILETSVESNFRYDVIHGYAEEKPAETRHRKRTTSSASKKAKKKGAPNFLKKDYGNWSNWSRASHAEYKLFDLGLIQSAVIEPGTLNDSCSLASSSPARNMNAFSRIESVQDVDPGYFEIPSVISDLTWMEKRRWNAATRVSGYSYMPVIERNEIDQFKNQSNDGHLMRHVCLVETTPELSLPFFLREEYGMSLEADRLDEVSEATLQANPLQDEQGNRPTLSQYPEKDYKVNDLPCFDVTLCQKIGRFFLKDPVPSSPGRQLAFEKLKERTRQAVMEGNSRYTTRK